MKETLFIPTKYLVTFLCLFLFIIILVTNSIFNNIKRHKNEINVFSDKKINGFIKSLKNENRGSYFLEIQTGKDIISIHSLPIAWEVNKYNIQVGDSIAKHAKSKNLYFFKWNKGVLEKLCEVEL